MTDAPVPVTIYHNPGCGTSRNVLALMRNAGIEPTIIEYLKTPPDRTTLESLIARMGIRVPDLLREKGTPFAELRLGEPHWTDAQLIDLMLKFPILINRPIVITPWGVRLCRPSEKVLDILPLPRRGHSPRKTANSSLTRKADVSRILPDLPNLASDLFHVPHNGRFDQVATSTHAPRFLLLYGSLRERSYSKLLTLEAQRLLVAMGAETRVFDPHGLPLPDSAPVTHLKVKELRESAEWSEGMVWCSPERHGAMTGIMKAQIDWIPLSLGSVRPTQGKTLAVMEVSGGSQSFNAVNQLRILGRWMRMITIPNQSSVAKAFCEFDESGRMKPSAYYERVVDVMEELVKFTLLTRDVAPYLVDRYSERLESAEQLAKRENIRSI